MRLIDADGLVKYKVTGEIGNLSGDFIPGFAIGNAPTIDAEPVRHGKWIIKKRWSMGKWHKWLECSECKYQDHDLETYEAIPFTGPSNYCPNCGAKMDLEV